MKRMHDCPSTSCMPGMYRECTVSKIETHVEFKKSKLNYYVRTSITIRQFIRVLQLGSSYTKICTKEKYLLYDNNIM